MRGAEQSSLQTCEVIPEGAMDALQAAGSNRSDDRLHVRRISDLQRTTGIDDHDALPKRSPSRESSPLRDSGQQASEHISKSPAVNRHIMQMI